MDFLSQLKPGSKASEYHAMAVFLGFVVAVGRGDIAVPWEVVSQIALVVICYMVLRTAAKLLDIWIRGQAAKPAGTEPKAA